jgi:site-specific DNA-methyltransferase (adenine-specific)
MNTIIYGCCIEESQKIETGTVDLILTDPPYGTIKGMTLGSWDKNTTAWDMAKPKKKYFRRLELAPIMYSVLIVRSLVYAPKKRIIKL